MKKLFLLTIFSIFFITPKVNGEKFEFSLSPDEFKQMSNCMANNNIMNALSPLVINSPAVKPLVLRGTALGRIASICDLYATGAINLREAKKYSKNALKFYDMNPNAKRDLDVYIDQTGFKNCQKIWQK